VELESLEQLKNEGMSGVIAASTCWASGSAKDAKTLLEKMFALEVTAVELDYRIRSDVFRDLPGLLRRSGLEVTSVHNFFPLPEEAEEPSCDLFLFTSDDKWERELAVKYTLRSLEHAADLGAQVVVVHLGSIPLRPQVDLLYEMSEKGLLGEDSGIKVWQELKKRREEEAPRYLDRVFLALDRILGAADKLGLRVGVENRYHYHEIPSLEDVGLILEKFEGAPIGYWHDTGHAHNWEVMGWATQEDFLSAYRESLIGIHLHDARGREDHLAPGTGEINFEAIFRYLREDVLRVAEVAPKSSLSEYRRGLNLLRDLGF
jgi:sugar phosphate isomerase/epimerase